MHDAHDMAVAAHTFRPPAAEITVCPKGRASSRTPCRAAPCPRAPAAAEANGTACEHRARPCQCSRGLVTGRGVNDSPRTSVVILAVGACTSSRTTRRARGRGHASTALLATRRSQAMYRAHRVNSCARRTFTQAQPLHTSRAQPPAAAVETAHLETKRSRRRASAAVESPNRRGRGETRGRRRPCG